MAHGAVVDEDMPALKALAGKTVWSLEDLPEIKPKFIECLRSSLEEATFEAWTNVNCAWKVWEQAGKKGASTMSYMAKAELGSVLGWKHLSQRNFPWP